MKEKNLYQIFKKKIKEADKDCFFYKIPDTMHLGGKKPFDSILILRGVPFAIEFKMKGVKVTEYQKVQLKYFEKADGVSKVFTYGVDDFEPFINSLMQIANMRILNDNDLFASNINGREV